MKFDPRTKILILTIVVISLAFCNSLQEEIIVIASVAIFSFIASEPLIGIVGILLYFLNFIIISKWSIFIPKGALRISVVAFFAMNQKIIATVMIGALIIRTSKIDEVVAAMNKMRFSNKIAIPFIIMLRYLPSIAKEWTNIHDALLHRLPYNKKQSWFKHRLIRFEFLYVPLLISASDTADNLAMAAIIRGIENPARKTSVRTLKFKVFDLIAVLIFLFIFLYLIII